MCHMDKVNILMRMNQPMMEDGNMVYMMGMQRKHGKMELLLQGHLSKGKRMDMESLSGLMDHTLKGSFKIILCMEKVHTNGQMAYFTKETGRMARWMAMEYIFGMMEENTRVTL